MFKVIFAALGIALLTGTSYYVSTEVGLQTAGSQEVVVEVPHDPGYAAVGQTYVTPDGSRVLVTAITRGDRGKHLIHANVDGLHRFALALFPTRWEHSFAMDRPSVDWTLRLAGGLAPTPLDQAPGRSWHVLD